MPNKLNIVLDKSEVNKWVNRKQTTRIIDSHKINIENNGKEENKEYISEDEKYDHIEYPPKNIHQAKLSLNSENYDSFIQEQILNKDDILQSMSEIFYQTQMLSNNSPIIKELVSMDTIITQLTKNISDFKVDAKEGNLSESDGKRIIDSMNANVSDVRDKMEMLVNDYENIRGKLFPVAEKIALIELAKNPYRIPGDPYIKVQINKTDVS